MGTSGKYFSIYTIIWNIRLSAETSLITNGLSASLIKEDAEENSRK